jgi:hypothetical protein
MYKPRNRRDNIIQIPWQYSYLLDLMRKIMDRRKKLPRV